MNTDNQAQSVSFCKNVWSKRLCQEIVGSNHGIKGNSKQILYHEEC